MKNFIAFASWNVIENQIAGQERFSPCNPVRFLCGIFL